MRIPPEKHGRLLPTMASQAPEDVFTNKYDWLLRWAMHFTKNDRSASEDLVQDTLVRLIVAWPTLRGSVDQTEAIFYSFLKYAYLTQLRRGSRVNFHELSAIEFDDLHLTLREDRSARPEELQQDLRRIVSYLCWRKRSSKSASVLILRFFHGYFPSEIARLTLMKRNSVDKLLATAREEVKKHLSDSARIRVAPKGGPPEPEACKTAVATEQFAAELRLTILRARSTPCLDSEILLRRCRPAASKPLDCELLAHIVSCATCLHSLTADFDSGSPSDGFHGFNKSGDSPLVFARRSKSGGGLPPATNREILRTIAGGREQLRRIYEHHPRSLMVLVNGDILAMRDVSSAVSEMKVLATSESPLGMVEVMSEQGLCLLTLYVPETPPEAPPETRRQIELSDGRRLDLRLHFHADSAVIEISYNNPLFLAVPRGVSQPEPSLNLETSAANVSCTYLAASPVTGARATRRRRTWLRTLRDRIARITLPEMDPVVATAIVCGLAAIAFLLLPPRTSTSIKPAEVLARAEQSEHAPGKSGIEGVIVQTVRIQTSKGKLQRTLYRDVQARRRAKEEKLDARDARLRSMLESAGVGWADPLSAASFGSWRDRAGSRQDTVKRPAGGLLTLTTTVPQGDVITETLTLREADFHAVQRSVEFRSAGTIEIAETSYSVLPWDSLNPEIFGLFNIASPVEGSVPVAPRLRLPAVPTPEQIDEADLGARLVLSRMHLDVSGRIQLLRQQNGIRVVGIVDDEPTKRQLEAQLRLVPHAVASIVTVQEMETRPEAAIEITNIRQYSASVPGPSALDRYAKDRGLAMSSAGAARQILVDASFKVKHESDAIAGLLLEFAEKEQLSPSARTALSELLIQHKAALLSALGSEERELIGLQLIRSPATVPGIDGDSVAVRSAAERNFTLCGDLTTGSASPLISAEAIAPQIAASIATLRAVVLRISSASITLSTVPVNAASQNA